MGCLSDSGTDGVGSGGNHGSGGKSNEGGSPASGGKNGSGGKAGSGGAIGSGGESGTGGKGSGGSDASGGAVGSGGKASGGSTSSGGAAGAGSGGKGTGGKGSGGVVVGTGGRTNPGGRTGTGTGGAAGGGGNPMGGSGSGGTTTINTTVTGDCPITVTSAAPSSKMGTVGVVEWSTTLSGLTSAQIVYTLNNAGSSILNKGGTAPVNLKNTNYKTLLLGLKPSSTYTFHVEATTASGTCKGPDATLTTTTLSGAPTVTRTVTSATALANGFIVTCSGMSGGMGGPGGGGGGGGNGAFILDADGTVVWFASGPSQCSRARMDFEGNNMWMLALNVGNSGGEMRFVSMDGQTSKASISGLSASHHDFTVLPGKIAAMVWASTGMDPESNLVEMNADGSGSATTVFKIGANLYAGGSSAMGGSSSSFHCNAITYHPADDTFTISDRNPNLYVKVKHDGTPVWQVGGSCSAAKAPKCAAGTWQVNHGHDFDKNGNMVLFNNGSGMGSTSTHVLELKLAETSSALSFTTVKDFTSSGNSSSSLGDVQRLPNGNTLITYSNNGVMLEVDPSWATVQTLKGSFGYADWRETLYGPPTRK